MSGLGLKGLFHWCFYEYNEKEVMLKMSCGEEGCEDKVEGEAAPEGDAPAEEPAAEPEAEPTEEAPAEEPAAE